MSWSGYNIHAAILLNFFNFPLFLALDISQTLICSTLKQKLRVRTGKRRSGMKQEPAIYSCTYLFRRRGHKMLAIECQLTKLC
ncbi:hypothetical protein Hdeb2414_s0010g00340841 [Helianthus debilis subsp. tardiflorus]